MKRKKLAVMMLCAGMCFACVSPAGAEEAAANPTVQAQGGEEDGISPQSEEIIWVVTKINGKKYRRLYNTTTGKFIGDWILCE